MQNKAYATTEDHPLYFIQIVTQTPEYERYMLESLRWFKNTVREKNRISINDVEFKINQLTQRKRAQKISSLIIYDTDFDQKISLNELELASQDWLNQSNSRKVSEWKKKEIIQNDFNKDGFIDYEEMKTLRSDEAMSIPHMDKYMILKTLFKSDPNGDGYITREELDTLAQSFYRILDKDNNFTISKGELYNQDLSKYLNKSNLVPYLNKYPETCSFEQIIDIPDDARIYGAYADQTPSMDMQIDRSGKKTQLIDLSINTDQPIILLLGASNPTIWSIYKTDKSKILAIVTLAKFNQIVHGLSDETPILSNISSRHIKSKCNNEVLEHDKEVPIQLLTEYLFGIQEYEFIKPNQYGQIYIGEIPNKPTDYKINSLKSLESYRLSGSFSSGEEGLISAINAGYLRSANQEDFDKWYMGMEKKHLPGAPKVHGLSHKALLPKIHKTRKNYVILKNDFVIPEGLIKGEQTNFFIAKDISPPIGNMRNINIYNFNDFTCTGLRTKC